MASATSILPLVTRSRRRALVLPREHGAWGMLLVPLVTGAAVGNPHGNRIVWILLFAVVALGLFCLRTPVEAGLRISPLRPQNDEERRLIHYFISVYSFVTILALAALMFWAHAYGLMLPGVAAAIALLLQSVLKQFGRQTRLNAQFMGAIALSSTSTGAYYLATGHFGATAAIIWLASWLFAANQIHFVQLRLHSARATTFGEKLHLGKGFLLHQVFSLLALGLMWKAGSVPGLALIAFAPLLVRGFAWFVASPRPLQVHRLGIRELLYAVGFGLFFIAGFHH